MLTKTLLPRKQPSIKQGTGLNKTAALFLILLIAASCIVGFLPVMAQDSVKTSAFIYVEPNRVTADQKAAITMLIEPPPPETVGCYSGLRIVITHPDGSVETRFFFH